MVLDPDCVRDLLLEVESTIQDVGICFTYPKESTLIGKYTRDKLSYHTQQCIWSGLLFTYDPEFDGQSSFHLRDLSPSGHIFLNNIRAKEPFEKTKSIASKLGNWSLSALQSIAAGVATAAINNQLGI